MPAVIAMPSEPPIRTRMVVRPYGAPAVLALKSPVATKPANVKATMLQARVPEVGAKAPKNGITPPAIKIGRAHV